MFIQLLRVFAFVSLVSVASPIVSAQSEGGAIYRATESSVFLIYRNDANGQPSALGSGFLIGPRLIITNAHVVAGGTPVITVGPVRIPAKVIKTDELNDLALLGVDVDLTSKPLSVTTEKTETGDRAFVIGNPEGLEKTLSEGIVSSLRDVDGLKLLQITNPISHGSSGGPVLNMKGQVIGVTVSMLKEGQNLNFAIPASVLMSFMAATEVTTTVDAKGSLQDLKSAIDNRTETYSEDASSEYQIKTKAIARLMKGILSTNDPETLIKLAHIAQDEDFDLSLQAAKKAEALKPSADAKLAIAQALNLLELFQTGDDKVKEQNEAANYAQSALKETKVPTGELLSTLAWSKEVQGNNTEALAFYTKALNAPRGTWGIDRETILRGVIRNSAALKLSSQRGTYFSQLASTGKATAQEWSDEGYRLLDEKQTAAAVADFQQAGGLSEDGIYWCRAALSEPNLPHFDIDVLLRDGKTCLTKETVAPTKNIADLNGVLTTVNVSLANALNTRGVYTEALNYAREATKLGPTDFSGFDAMGDAFYYLQRYTESVSAEKEAIRLSNGKYSYTHFRLGSAYFELEQWKSAQDSFEQAWQEDQRNDIAAYNVAASLSRQGYYSDAAQWYRKVLRVNPNREDKAELLKKIEALSR
jgi:tetratricopeptide (TPR) repeat protein